MSGSDENHPGLIRSSSMQVEDIRNGGGKFAMGGGIGQNRRALSNINRNLIGALPYPCAINKRALVEKQVPLEKKQAPIPVHRPVTRKFAAQLANKHQTPDGRNNQHARFTAAPRHEPVPIDSEDCIIIDSEEYKRKIEEPVPMYVQQTEEMMEEIDRMEKEKETEIEMEDIDEDPVVDIDLADENNPLAVVEYIDSIYAFYKKVEGTSCVSPNYMGQQCDINERMRGILIDWLIEVHYKFELMEETLYLTVNLIDRFLAAQPVVRKKLQLVGVTAMLLACKYEEVSVPVVDDLILISDKAYTRQEVLNMEKLMVNALQFNLSAPTPYVFMRRFLKAAQSDKKLELLAFFMVELCLVEYEMLKFPPSFLAAAAVYTAQSTLVGSKQWTKTSEFHTCYPLEQLQDCARQMVTFHQNAATGKLTGVHRKYSTSKYGYAARTAPALFLLEDDHRL